MKNTVWIPKKMLEEQLWDTLMFTHILLKKVIYPAIITMVGRHSREITLALWMAILSRRWRLPFILSSKRRSYPWA
jgi:hypothetical protein